MTSALGETGSGHGDGLYVQSVIGPTAAWFLFCGRRPRHRRPDRRAYRAKYHRYATSAISRIVSAEAGRHDRMGAAGAERSPATAGAAGSVLAQPVVMQAYSRNGLMP